MAEVSVARNTGANASTRSLANALGVSRRTLSAYNRSSTDEIRRLTGVEPAQGLERIGAAMSQRYIELQRAISNSNGTFQQRARYQNLLNRADESMLRRLWRARRGQ